MGKPIFRRVHGRIIPLTKGKDGTHALKRKPGVKKSLATVSTGAGLGLAFGGDSSESALRAASSGFAIAAGVVGGLPFRGAKGLVVGQVASVALDALGSAANAAASAQQKGSRKDKVKTFAKREAANFALGYGAFGATVLSNPGARGRISSGVKALLRKVRGF